MAGGDEAQSAAAAEKPSEMELLRGMLQQQLELAAAAARREERMAALLERVLPGPTAVQDATAPAQAAAGPTIGFVFLDGMMNAMHIRSYYQQAQQSV